MSSSEIAASAPAVKWFRARAGAANNTNLLHCVYRLSLGVPVAAPLLWGRQLPGGGFRVRKRGHRGLDKRRVR